MSKKKKQVKLTPTIKNKLRNDFVQGFVEDDVTIFPTLDDVIKKYRVAKSTVYRVAQKESWKIQKESFYNEYLKKLDQKRASAMADKSKKVDDQTLKLTDALFVTIAQNLSQNNNDIQNGKKGLPPPQITALAQALSITQKSAKLALGEATHNIDATINENNDAYRRAMELLDSVEESRGRGIQSTH
tara:strand:- start:560 stop:1120 length:561 start_codon:yes stop_codon:yes gene_type:complete